ncbi:MAG: hypothetical protein IJX77_10265 [Ruminococcus sp.]|nr:hypothetical protein [Ruminococcus sp.]
MKMNFEGGNSKSKGVARNRKYVNLADVIRKIDYITSSYGASSRMRKEIKEKLDNLRYFTEEEFKIESGGE